MSLTLSSTVLNDESAGSGPSIANILSVPSHQTEISGSGNDLLSPAGASSNDGQVAGTSSGSLDSNVEEKKEDANSLKGNCN